MSSFRYGSNVRKLRACAYALPFPVSLLHHLWICAYSVAVAPNTRWFKKKNSQTWFQVPQAELAQSQMKSFIKSRLNIFILWFLWCPVVVFVVVVRLVLLLVLFEAGLSTQHTHAHTPWQTHSERGYLIHAWPASCPPDLCYCSASPSRCCCYSCIHLLECNEEEPNLKNNLNFCKTA